MKHFKTKQTFITEGLEKLRNKFYFIKNNDNDLVIRCKSTMAPYIPATETDLLSLFVETIEEAYKHGAVDAIHGVMSLQADYDVEIANKVEKMLFNSPTTKR